MRLCCRGTHGQSCSQDLLVGDNLLYDLCGHFSSILTLHDLPDIELHVEVGVLAGGGGRGEEDGHETEQRPGPAAEPAGHPQFLSHHQPSCIKQRWLC